MNRKRRMEQRYGSESAWELSIKFARLSLLEVEQDRMMWQARRGTPQEKVEWVKQAREWNRLIRRLRFHIRRMEMELIRASGYEVIAVAP